MTRLAIVAACALVFACDSPPPPIGSDAGGDAKTADVAAPDSGVDASSDGSTQPDSSATCTSLDSPPANPTCASCVQSTCCATWNSCVANSDCTGYVACVRLCYPDASTADAGPPNPDAGFDGGEGSAFACAKACMKQFPNGVNDGIVVVDCEDNGCGGKCP
ncbi:MAG TPA: hypothetical protein VGH28_25335 [Polyangiaceae bacterium]|jgi:hypothetical protein